MRLKLLGALAILLFLLPNIASAALPTFCTGPNSTPAVQALPTIPIADAGVGLALIALTISFDAIAIGYMLSRIFPNLGSSGSLGSPPGAIRAWLQNEYWEVAKSAIIIVAIYGSITLVANLATLIVSVPGATGIGSISTLISGSEVYLCGVNSNITNIWGQIGIISEGTGFWSSLQVGFYIPTPPLFDIIDVYAGISFLPFGNWMLQTGNFFISPYQGIINDMVNFVLFPFSSLFIGLITTLPAFAYVGITFFIPLGLMFRALPFIRGIGGTLIAIGVALGLIFPALLVLFNYPITSILTSTFPISVPAATVANYGDATCNLPNPAGVPLGTIVCGAFASFLNGISTAQNFAHDAYASDVVFSTTAIYTYMDRLLSYGFYMIIQMVLFVIDLIIMYPLIDGLARSMGGSIRLSLGGKLKLA